MDQIPNRSSKIEGHHGSVTPEIEKQETSDVDNNVHLDHFEASASPKSQENEENPICVITNVCSVPDELSFFNDVICISSSEEEEAVTPPVAAQTTPSTSNNRDLAPASVTRPNGNHTMHLNENTRILKENTAANIASHRTDRSLARTNRPYSHSALWENRSANIPYHQTARQGRSFTGDRWLNKNANAAASRISPCNTSVYSSGTVAPASMAAPRINRWTSSELQLIDDFLIFFGIDPATGLPMEENRFNHSRDTATAGKRVNYNLQAAPASPPTFHRWSSDDLGLIDDYFKKFGIDPATGVQMSEEVSEQNKNSDPDPNDIHGVDATVPSGSTQNKELEIPEVSAKNEDQNVEINQQVDEIHPNSKYFSQAVADIMMILRQAKENGPSDLFSTNSNTAPQSSDQSSSTTDRGNWTKNIEIMSQIKQELQDLIGSICEIYAASENQNALASPPSAQQDVGDTDTSIPPGDAFIESQTPEVSDETAEAPLEVVPSSNIENIDSVSQISFSSIISASVCDGEASPARNKVSGEIRRFIEKLRRISEATLKRSEEVDEGAANGNSSQNIVISISSSSGAEPEDQKQPGSSRKKTSLSRQAKSPRTRKSKCCLACDCAETVPFKSISPSTSCGRFTNAFNKAKANAATIYQNLANKTAANKRKQGDQAKEETLPKKRRSSVKSSERPQKGKRKGDEEPKPRQGKL